MKIKWVRLLALPAKMMGAYAQTQPITKTAEVNHISDGDTLNVTFEGSEKHTRVRFGCISAPETRQAGGDQSCQSLYSQVRRGDVVPIQITEDSDKYGRPVGILFKNRASAPSARG